MTDVRFIEGFFVDWNYNFWNLRIYLIQSSYWRRNLEGLSIFNFESIGRVACAGAHKFPKV